MKKHIFHLFATTVLAASSSLAFSQTAFDSLVQAADNQIKQFAQTGTCSGSNCTTTATESTNCAGGACSETDNESSSVAKALKEIKFVSGKPNLKADYYIYLYSASWCPPCRKLMPDIVKEYADIQKSGKVELILVGADQNEKKVKEYVDKYKVDFPATWQSSKGVASIPGNKPPRGIPGAVIVDKAGNIIISDHGTIVLNWEKYTIDKK